MQTFVREKNDPGSYVLAGRTLMEAAESLNAPPERRKNEYWILGVDLLANEDYEAAKSAFTSSSEFCDLCSFLWLSRGWRPQRVD